MSIGLEIAIARVRDTPEIAEHSYRVLPGRGGIIVPGASGAIGLVAVDKQTGAVRLLRASADEPEARDLWRRVEAKLRRHWAEGKLPDRTHWAA